MNMQVPGIWFPSYGLSGVQTLLRRTRGSSFAPTDISGLKLWLKADGTLWQDSARTTAVSADADPVGAWDDAGSDARHFTQAGSGLRPSYQTGEINSKPVVRGDGSDDYMTGSDTGMPSGTTHRSVFIVIRPATSPAGFTSDVIFWWGTNGTNEGMGWSYVNTGSIYVLRQFSWGGANVDVTVGDIAGVTKLFTGIWDGTDGIVRVNGGSETTATQSQNTTLTGNAYLLKEPSGFTQFFDGDIAELLVYNSALTGTDLSNVESYLNSRWAVY